MTPDVRQALESITLFAGLPAAHLDQLARFSKLRPIRAGETVFCQGEPSPYCFGVVSGEVMIQRVSKDKRFPTKVLGLLGRGNLFGESAFFEDSPRLAQANATQDGVVIAILGKSLREWVRTEPEAGVPVAMGLLRNSIERLHRTNHELSTLYGVGRLLGTGQPFQDRVSSAMDFLRNSLPSIDGIILYQKSPYWDEYEALLSLPAGGDPPAIPSAHPLLKSMTHDSGAVTLSSPEQRQHLASVKLPWTFPASSAFLPLLDRDKSDHPLQGFILVVSQKDVAPFASESLLMLSAIAEPFTEALSRYHREQDQDAQSRLQRSRQDYRS